VGRERWEGGSELVTRGSDRVSDRGYDWSDRVSDRGYDWSDYRTTRFNRTSKIGQVRFVRVIGSSDWFEFASRELREFFQTLPLNRP